MPDDIHFRHELKYDIAYPQYLVLRQKLRVLMKPDPHVNADGRYRIMSLYFDNYDDRALREKLDGVNMREKFRLRYYNDDTAHIRLEKKQKVNGLCNKLSAPISPETCRRLIAGERWLSEDAVPLMQELNYRMDSQLLRPRSIVSYVREPYIYEPGNVRVTFDMEIRSGLNSVDFLDPRVETLRVQEPGRMILEVKYDEFLPGPVQDMLQIGSARVGAFSKYAACRSFL